MSQTDSDSGERYSLEDLMRVMQRLRDPEQGCPWDLQQDFRSIVPSTLEECYELAAAIEANDFEHTAEELGDVLFQVVFYSQLGREAGLFSFESVVHSLVQKLIRRHPHVFARGELEGVVEQHATLEDVGQTWEAIKASERAGRNHSGLLDDVPTALPALPRAQKLQKRAAKVSFDWPDAAAVFDKLREELTELEQVIGNGREDRIEDELGDVLFTCVNLARHLQIDAEASLRRSSGKFERRFQRMEQLVAMRGRSLDELNATELDQFWLAAKDEVG